MNNGQEPRGLFMVSCLVFLFFSGAGKRHKWNKAEVDPVRIKRLTWGIETGSGPFATFA